MIDISRLINMVSLVYGKSIDNDINKLNQLVYSFSQLSDEELKQKCFDKQIDIKDKSIWSYIIEKNPFIRKRSNEAIIEKLAIGIAAFSKCPADLSNTALYPSQINAALALTQSCVLQMDTGEGKTYALLPAVFALSCKFDKVYILCANEYLALRDATRTKSYWDFVGLDVQFCSKSDKCNDSKWKGDVIYTTLTALLFKGLYDDLYKIPYERKISYDAIIIDEIDAVLFDNDSNHILSKEVKSNVYDWMLAINYAKQLKEDVDITIDREVLTASLTIIGDGKLKNYLHENNISKSQYGQLRRGVEISFIALSLEEDRDYVFLHNMIYSLDRLNGEIEYNKTVNWIIPLEIIRGLNPRPHKISLHEINPRVFLTQFNHMSGMSGTVKEDSAEYFYTYSLPIVMIEPRIKRQKGDLEDEVYKSHREGINAICEKIIQAVEEQRPVLVGTQNIKDAQVIYNLCSEKYADNESIKLNLITGKNDKKIAEIYQLGGQVGSVIIATQLAGRGVDIRLSDEARNNGGLVLLGFERGMDMRHDKQFLGRAGRQGDPYTALFISTLEGHLMQLFSSKRIMPIMEAIGLKEGEFIQHKMISNSIVRAQNKVRANNFLKRRANDFKISTEESIYQNIKNWFNCLNAGGESSLPKSFILFVIEHFIEQNLNILIQNNLNSEQANNIIQIISLNLNIKKENLINPVSLEGKTQDIVHKLINDCLCNYVVNTVSNNDKERKNKNLLWRYLDSWSRYNFIYCRISRINDISNQPSNDKFCDDEFDKIVNNLNIKIVEIENSEIYFLQINSATDIKCFYYLLDFLEYNISTLSEDKYKDALCIINNVDFCWVNSIKVFEKNLEKINSRTPYSIAHWTIINSGMSYRDFEKEFDHNLRNEDLTILQYYRLLSDGFTSEWDKIESGLSASILRNILTALESLDELFFYEDNTVSHSTEFSEESKFGKEWDKIKNSSSTLSQSKIKIDNLERKLISDFIAQSESEFGLGINFDKNSLEDLLKRFLAKNPIHTLHFPDKIIMALELWKSEEIRTGVMRERMNQNHKWIELFLSFLSKKSIIMLPSFKHKIQFVLQNVIKNINDYKIVIPMVQLTLWGILFVLLSILGDWFHPLTYNFVGISLIDKFLCAGWLQKGVVTAPIFLLYLLSSYPIKENVIAKYAGSWGCSILLILFSIQSFYIGNHY